MYHLKFNRTLLRTVIATSFAMAPALSFATVNDPVVLTFSTVGDSRQDAATPDASDVIPSMVGVGNCPVTTGTGSVPNPGLTGQDCKWLQNSAAWSRIISQIQAQKSNLLFFNGDMILGYGLADVPVTRASSTTLNYTGSLTPAGVETVEAITVSSAANISNIVSSDLMQIYQQYGFWRGMVAPLIESGTYVVPVPGNHETECKRCKSTVNNPNGTGTITVTKASQWQNENAWRDNMGDLIIDQHRLGLALAPTGLSLTGTNLTAPSTTFSSPANIVTPQGTVNPDKITTPQNQLSYSFDVGSNHFAVINTDPTGNDSHAPSSWLDADLTAAVSKGASHLFVFGHKPAFYYCYAGAAPVAGPSSLWLADNTAANTFWNVISKHNATYFAGHEHIYNVSQPAPSGQTASADNCSGLSFVNGSPNAANAAYQVIVGAGGSPFDDLESPVNTVSGVSPAPLGTLKSDRMYSWATVSIHKSGTVTMNTYGFENIINTNQELNPGQMYGMGPVQLLGTFTLPTAK
jgi:hypothetical protein